MADGQSSTRLVDALEELRAAAFDLEPRIRAAAVQVADAAMEEGLPARGRFEAPPVLNGLRKALFALRRDRAHLAVQIAAEALAVVGITPAWLYQLHAQSLVERGSLLPALGLVREGARVAMASADSFRETELLSLEGRVFKEMYVAAARRTPRARDDVRAQLLRQSADAYGLAYARLKGGPDANFPACNLVALATLAQREGVPLALVEPADAIALGILKDVAGRENAPAWDIASMAEAHAYRGDWPKAIEAIDAYLKRLEVVAKDEGRDQLPAFEINGTLRQFSEVWGIDSGGTVKGQIVSLLRCALLTSEGGAIRLNPEETARLFAPPSSAPTCAPPSAGSTQAPGAISDGEAAEPTSGPPPNYEKVFGMDGPMGLKRLNDLIDCSRIVARVITDTPRAAGLTVGTGFVIAGAYVHESFKDDVLLLTNAHVISPNPRDRSATVAGEARLRFDNAGFDDPKEEIDLRESDWLWTSSPTQHDTTIFKVNSKHVCHAALMKLAMRLKLAPGLPPLRERSTGPGAKPKSTRVYVIGHPLGQELSFSLNDNDLIDYENVYGVAPGPEPRKLHYLAPTEPGNSGSPVFNSRTMQLIGIHHAGGERPRLNGQGGTYLANEGLWIRPALNAFLLERGLGPWNPG